ncbi:MAG: primosomal protein N' [Clostridiales bacterium]|nr:primosomal protein N' [Clostridiales bacterium]
MLLPKIARIAVEQASFHFDKLYDYLLPDGMGPVSPGCRVLVPFGGGNRRRQGILMEITEHLSPELNGKGQTRRLKPVIAVLDHEPFLNEELLALARWLRERTFCPLFDAVKAMLPTGLSLKIRTAYCLAEGVTPEQTALLLPEERQAALLASRSRKGIDREKMLGELGLSADSDLPERLVQAGLLVRLDAASRLVGDASLQMMRPLFTGAELEEAAKARGCTSKQRTVLRLLEEAGSASVKELCYFCSVTPAVAAALQKKGLAEFYQAEVLRSPCREAGCPPVVSSQLNPEQQAAYDALLALYRSGKAAASLLYGVTGSGKTQVYMNLIDQVIADGRQVIVLVPEISLTPQMMELFLSRYGNRVAVMHSALAIGERLDEWKRIRRGEACIVVGTRSAIFAPCSQLGLIVMDEEQEHTYKSEASPRYHARDVAKFRCAHQGALLLLTSATPSVESYHAAKSGRYSLQVLSSRYGGAALPRVEVVDMRQEGIPLEGGVISERLKREMDSCLASERQVILLLNRRGFNTFVSCRSCGHVISCPSCSISLTYHRANGRLMCHYCGHTQAPSAVCPACRSDKLRYAGLGTQRVEQELELLFPGVPVLRMDTDTTMSRFSYENRFREFAQGRYRIMVGTQMVAKGLDFPQVGLVGVLSADQSLYSGDFRSFENTFSLLTQVVGRAGRREQEGKALIQTYTPESYVIELAARQDYTSFYELEIASRRMMKYPPYTDLCLFGFVGAEEEAVRQGAHQFLNSLQHAATQSYRDIPVIALDPSPATVARVSGKYRYKLLIKTVNNARLRQLVTELVTAFGRMPENRSVSLFVDVNPAVIL